MQNGAAAAEILLTSPRPLSSLPDTLTGRPVKAAVSITKGAKTNVEGVVVRRRLFSQPRKPSISARAKLLNVLRALQYVVRSDDEHYFKTAVDTECEAI